jgi:hypothetical protein
MIKSFKNDTLHGLTKVFNLKYDLIKREFFFINGKMVLSKKFLTNKSIDWFMFDNYRISCSDSGLANGYLAWNNKEEVLSDQSHYYQVTATDTINKGESFNAIISFINQNVWHIRLELGEMDENLNYIEKPSVYEISNQLDVSIIPKNIGDNLLMGKLYAIRDTIVNGEIKEYEEEYIFYHEFYVREKKVNWWKFW